MPIEQTYLGVQSPPRVRHVEARGCAGLLPAGGAGSPTAGLAASRSLPAVPRSAGAHRWRNKWGSQEGQYCGPKRHRLSIFRVQRRHAPIKMSKLLQLRQETTQLEPCNRQRRQRQTLRSCPRQDHSAWSCTTWLHCTPPPPLPASTCLIAFVADDTDSDAAESESDDELPAAEPDSSYHASFGIQKKLRAACKSQSCALIQPWMQCITNHLYFVAAMAEGDAELIMSMWRSLLNHICDKHDGHEGPFAECLHEPLGERLWMTSGDLFVAVMQNYANAAVHMGNLCSTTKHAYFAALTRNQDVDDDAHDTHKGAHQGHDAYGDGTPGVFGAAAPLRGGAGK
ncbi:hypothetical protein HPB48_004233 [Haemaphysalis longicornis]|uniref:Uncharacterized protein n=1 Tax=Haemaphysalis longicornis TaxID=44386 RepID=A0A9J6GNP8_HAELO|nr:hypothetical protein HPB48_004233 [Haemaphysalis longicornis]